MKTSGKFEFVYFDLDDTLLDHGSAERLALADLHSEFFSANGHPETLTVAQLQHDYHVGNVGLWRQYSLAQITADQLRHDRFAKVCEKYGMDLDPLLLSDRYMSLYANHWSVVPGALTAFRTVSEHSRVGIITNGFASTQRDKLSRFSEFRQASDSIVISEEFGQMKPSRALFDHALSAAGCEPESILYVGDSWHSDVEGGLGAGWNVAWYAAADKIETAPEIEGRDRLLCFTEWSELVAHCR